MPSSPPTVAERPHPFDLVFGPMAGERFPAIRLSMEGTGRDLHDRDAFLLDRAAVELLRELVPDEHDPAEIGDFAAALHHAFLYWHHGRTTITLTRAQIGALLLPSVAPSLRPSDPPSLRPSAYYAFPERLIWAQLAPEGPHEPLDGLYIEARPAGVRTLGVFGLHPARPGLSVAEVEGPRPGGLARTDGSPIFSPVLPGGGSAGLHSLVGAEELLELAYRAGGTTA